MNKNIFVRIISLCLAIVAICATLAGCSSDDEKQINALFDTFEQECNSLNLQGIIDCMDPDVTSKISAALGVVSLFSGTDTSAILDKISQLITDDSTIDGKDFFASVTIDVDKIEIDEEKQNATVDATVGYEVSSIRLQNKVQFTCKNISDKWYITNAVMVK